MKLVVNAAIRLSSRVTGHMVLTQFHMSGVRV
jgi:hypothetical protein